MHHMQTGAHPHRDLIRAQMRRQIGLRHQGPVSQVPRETGGRIAQQLLTHRAPHPIGTDQGIGMPVLPLCAVHIKPLGTCLPALHRLPQLHINTRGLGRSLQQTLQVGPVDGGVGSAIKCLSPLAQTQAAQHPPSLGISG